MIIKCIVGTEAMRIGELKRRIESQFCSVSFQQNFSLEVMSVNFNS